MNGAPDGAGAQLSALRLAMTTLLADQRLRWNSGNEHCGACHHPRKRMIQ
jgi:hypothetical protein